MGGIETITHTVSFILYYLSANPEAQENIYKETLNMNDEITQEDISKAFYTRAAIHEAFRLSPTAFAVARILEEDFYLSDYHLKQGVSFAKSSDLIVIKCFSLEHRVMPNHDSMQQKRELR